MISKFAAQASIISPSIKYSSMQSRKRKISFRIVCCEDNTSPSSSSEKKSGFKLAAQSLSDKKWKFNDIDASAVQETINQWMSKTHSFLNEVASPLVKTVNDRIPSPKNENQEMEDVLITEQTIDSTSPGGELSEESIVSIEQFSRMNGMTGQKMQKVFKALVRESTYNEPRNLVEYCCFRFLSRNNAEVHPNLKEPAFQRLIFTTMLAWENPYGKRKNNRRKLIESESFRRKLVREEAFVRIAPAVSGLADCPTAHNLFKALAGNDPGITFTTWSTYISELIKVHEGRKTYQYQDFSYLSTNERVLCLGSSRKQPVIRWEKNMAWPGRATLTDKALHFETVGMVGDKASVRIDLTCNDSRVEKTRVGPLGSNIFDSAISVTSGPESKPLVLEFVDLGGEMRRDVWYAFLNEVIALHKFIREYGPKDADQSVKDIFGAHKGKDKAIHHAVNAITRLQALQFMKKTLDDPSKLVPFSYLQNSPYGDIVLQTLAVNFWGGPIIKKPSSGEADPKSIVRVTGESMESSSSSSSYNLVTDVDGSVYLRKWMRSSSWSSNASLAFWKSTNAKEGVVLSKNLVVADMSLVERASATCRDKLKVAEKAQATIDAAMIEGIPSNIDLLKELILPLTLTVRNFEKLRKWEDPLVTASFIALVYTLIFRNLLSYVFPMSLMMLASAMLVLKSLKEQGRLGRFFGNVTIYDQPPSNTIQKIIALKEALREVENNLQNFNVVLLKIRSMILAGNPQITTEVALVLLLGSVTLLLVPFKYVVAFLIFDLFTRELEFRREMVVALMRLLKERWDSVPAASVVVLPFEEKDSGGDDDDDNNPQGTEVNK